MTDETLVRIRAGIEAHARPDLGTSVDGLLLSRVTDTEPDHSLTEPMLVLLAQGAKRLLLGEEVFEYRAGDCLVVTADLPVSGHFVRASAARPALGLGFRLRREVIASLLLELPPRGGARPVQPAIATGQAGPELLDVLCRLLGLLDRPADAAVLAPLYERELLWRLLTGPFAATVRQIGLADSDLAHVNAAIGWIRRNYAEPMAVPDLARLAAMSTSVFHRRFRAVTGLSPLQFQKRIRLQQARTLLMSHTGDVAGVGHRVGYDSPTQFSREYRRQFGVPPGRDALALHRHRAARQLP